MPDGRVPLGSTPEMRTHPARGLGRIVNEAVILSEEPSGAVRAVTFQDLRGSDSVTVPRRGQFGGNVSR